jgi:outer membrane protein TolC
LADVERAAQHQPQTRVVRAATDTARGQADQARAPLLPQVTATAQYTIALAQQKAAMAGAQVLLITAQNNYKTGRAQLNQAAGLATDTDL